MILAISDGLLRKPDLGMMEVDTIYHEVGKVGKFLRRMHYHVPLNGREYWYASWKKDVAKYKTIIVFDGILGTDVIAFIRKHNKKCRLIIYYINKVEPTWKNSPNNIRKLGIDCEYWSFDKKDCTRMNMKYNPFFYTEADYVETSEEVSNDVFFIGVDKGCLNKLLELKNSFDKQNCSSEMIIVKDRRKKYSETMLKYVREDGIPYDDVKRHIAKTKCILDINMEGQEGITLRPLEAMFFRKKLITNNKDIVNYDFYNPHNIFIWGVDSEKNIKQFINSEYVEIDDSIKKRYTVVGWLERFNIKW